jgi:transposase
MKPVPLEVRDRVVKAYRDGLTGTYISTARVFGIGEATVSRLLHLERAGVPLAPRFSTGRKRRIDLEWLRRHVAENEDARLVDRIAAWQAHSGLTSSVGAMWSALRALGVTHKKRLR